LSVGQPGLRTSLWRLSAASSSSQVSGAGLVSTTAAATIAKTCWQCLCHIATFQCWSTR